MKAMKKSVLCAFLLVGCQGVLAADVTETYEVSNGGEVTFTENMNIAPAEELKSGIGVFGKMGTLTANEGVITTITTTGVGDLKDDYAAINVKHKYEYVAQQGNAKIVLGETHIKSGYRGIFASTASTDPAVPYSIDITIGDNSTIDAGQIAINANELSTITVGNNASIKGNVSGESAGAVISSNRGNVTIGDHAKIENNTHGPAGIAVYSGHFIDANKEFEKNMGLMTIGNDATISAISEETSSHGVKAGYKYQGKPAWINVGRIKIGDRATITAVGKYSSGIMAVVDKSTIEVGTDATIKTTGQQASAVKVGDTYCRCADKFVDGGSITLGERATITTTGFQSHGIHAIRNGTIDVGKDVSVEVSSFATHAVYAESGGRISLHGGTITSDVGNAIYANGSKPNASYNVATIEGKGVFHIQGLESAIRAQEGGIVHVEATDKSAINGAVHTDNTGKVELSLEKESVWTFRGSSNLNVLHNDNSLIDMSEGRSFNRLEVEELSGENGTIRLAIDAKKNADNSDRIYVKKSFTGTQYIDLLEVNSYQPVGEEGVGTVVATVKDNQGTFLAKDGEGTLYWKRYELAQKDTEDTSANYTKDWYLKSVKTIDNPTTSTVTILSGDAVNYHTWRTELDTLMKRMGELRHDGEAQQGIWVRGKKTKSSRADRFHFTDYLMSYELGYDVQSDRTDDRVRFSGVSLSYAKGDTHYQNGSGTHHSKSISLYSTTMGEKGTYLDFIFKLSKLQNDFAVYDTNANRTAGKFDNWGWSVSAEYGRKRAISKSWFIEPQAQITIGHLSGENYTTDNNIQVHQAGIKSMVGRIGINVGKDIDSHRVIYGKLNLLHEFAGTYDITMNSGQDTKMVSGNFGDTWLEYGIGAALRIDQDTHLYMDIERSSGSKFSKKWQWNIGARWKFN